MEGKKLLFFVNEDTSNSSDRPLIALDLFVLAPIEMLCILLAELRAAPTLSAGNDERLCCSSDVTAP